MTRALMLSPEAIERSINPQQQQQHLQSSYQHQQATSHHSEIRLMIYDLSSYNNFLSCIGIGIFHTGVCVHGVEYSYGGHDQPSSGCFVTTPHGAPPPAVFREAIVIGKTQKSAREVMQLVASMGGGKFMGNKYHLLENNCNHFSAELLSLLVNDKSILSRISWVNRAAQAALCCSCLLPADAMSVPQPPTDSSSGEGESEIRLPFHDEDGRPSKQARIDRREEEEEEDDFAIPDSPQNEILLSPGKTKSKSPISARGKSIHSFH